jgi:hypothetical protein
MAIKHATIKAVRGAATANTASENYVAGGTITAGAPVVFSSGLVVEATDDDAGAAGPIVGFSEHAAVITEDVRVVPVLPNQRFLGSLTDVAASVASDGGTKALAQTDLSATPRELHKDDTTGKWVVGATGGANACVIVKKLIDPIGSTTDDAVSFGSENTGKAEVEFTIQVADTIFA